MAQVARRMDHLFPLCHSDNRSLDWGSCISHSVDFFAALTPKFIDPFTPQPDVPKKNGFLALAEFDKPANGGNNDGVIDAHDAVFQQLRLWQDTNHDGVSESGELHLLGELGVRSFELDHKYSRRTDEYGNEFKYRAKVWNISKAQVGRWAWDVFLVGAQ